VSVVTPFYNSADTLNRCIESVLSQSHTDFEYLLADNRSNDESAQIARYHAERDPRIVYLRFEDHLPKTRNYNRALREMSAGSRYCKIVQADDFIYPQCLERMLQVATHHPEVGVVSARRVAGDVIDPPLSQTPQLVSSGIEMCRKVLRGEIYPFGSPTSVMYRADLVRSAGPEFFDDRNYFDDVDAILSILRTSDFAFCEEVLSFTQRDPASTFGKVISYFPSLLNRYAMIRTRGHEFFTKDEAQDQLKEVAQEYYEELVRALRRRDRVELFRFHRSMLASLGLGWEWPRLCTTAATMAGGWFRRRIRRALGAQP